jgi:hypothetical protein
MKHDWRSVPIPERMQHLPKDVRGFPIPANVLVVDGKPYFTINDSRWTNEKAIGERRCSLCGEVLTTAWFIGGPLSCFNEYGAFRDPPVHYECGTYALQVCPYLVMPSYNKRLDDKQAKQDRLAAKAGLAAYVDPTVLDTRPPFFGVCQTLGYRAKQVAGTLGFIPKRPWVRYEIWAGGRQITDPEKISALAAEYQAVLDMGVDVKTPTVQRVAKSA